MRNRLLAAAALALLVLLLAVSPALAAPSALDADVTTRVQSLDSELSAPMRVNVPQELTVTDSNGVTIQCTIANPLSALFLTAEEYGYEFETGSGGAFISSIAGLQEYWLFTVNGCIPMVSMLDWSLAGGEQLLFFQADDDPLAPWVDKELVVDGPGAISAGGEVVLTVLGDDLQKANTVEDAAKFGLDPASGVETPEQFVPVAGAALHVGNLSFLTDENGEVTVTGLAAGAYSVWAEKPFDSDWQYISSSPSNLLVVEFSDVRSSHNNPYYLAIHRVAARGIATGYVGSSGPEFKPNDFLLRAQFAKMLSLALDLDIVSGASSPFLDLGAREAGNPYPHDYVAAVYQAGLVKGVTATAFGTWENVLRAQVVTMVTRAAQARGLLEDPPSGFASTWGSFSADHDGYARLAEWNGLLDGLGLDGSASDPWAPMTRGETAQVIDNLVQLIDSQGE